MTRRDQGLIAPSLLMLPLAVCFAGSANAGDWKLSDSFSVSATSVSRDRQAGGDTDRLLLSATPSFSLNGKGGRVSANVRYGLTGTYEAQGGGDQRLTHSLNGSFNSRLYEQMIFLNGSAYAGLASTNNSSADVDALNPDNETIQTYGFSLSPEFRHRLGSYASLVSRNSLSYSGSDRGNSDDVVRLKTNIGIQNGSRFSRLNWSAGYTSTITDNSNSQNEVRSFDLNAGYRFNRKIRLNAGLGYSDSDAATRRSSNSAINWSVGANWNPNPRTSASANYGHNYSGNVWSGNFSHVTRRTTIAGYFSRSLTNTSTLLTETDLFTIIDPTTGLPIVNPETGEELVLPVQVLVPSTENFINTTIGTSVSIKGRRSTLSGSVSFSDRTYDLSGRNEENSKFNLSATRQLSQRLSVYARTGYSEFSSSTGSSNNTIDFSVGASTSLGRRSSLSASITHRSFDSDVGTDYDEQRISLSFSTSFL